MMLASIDGLYRQEEVDEAIARRTAVCLVETAKEADSLWSREVPATCCPGGTQKWRPEYSRMLSDADVVLIQYSGNSGRERIDQIGEALHGIAGSIWVLDSKLIQADSTTEELWTIIGATREWAPPATKEPYLAVARPLVYYADFGKVVKLDWIIKGILAKGHNSYLFGPPGGGKSALYGSAATYLAAARDNWHGFKIRNQLAAVIFAMERADLVRKRIWAECQREQLDNVPVAVCAGLINLMDPKCVDEIVGTILRAEDQFGMEVGLAVLDTFNKAVAAGGGDENTARDQNRAWGHLRQVHEVLARWHTIHIGAIGHTGKDESRGARGSNAADGDNDVSLQIKDEGAIKSVTIYKANELPEGPLMRFKMEPFDTGLKDEDGDAVEVWLAGSDKIDPAPIEAHPKLTKNQQTMFAMLHAAGSGGLTSEEWNERAREAGVGVGRRADLYDNRSTMQSKKLVYQINKGTPSARGELFYEANGFASGKHPMSSGL
jgi:AAA domain